MTVQEQEQREYEAGRASEQQNALALSIALRKPDDSELIAEAVDRGWFVIVEETTVYCPHTDGIIGSAAYIRGINRTREGAEKVLSGLLSKGELNPESNAFVLPRPSQSAPAPSRVLSASDLPF